MVSRFDHPENKASGISRGCILLTGIPGSGKSTTGRKLAELLDAPFIDLDSQLEHETGKKIADIFASDGEQRFRELETESLRKLLASGQGAIIALGGGALEAPETMTSIRESRGLLIWLMVEPSRAATRLEREGAISERPLLDNLTGDSLARKLSWLLEERQGNYRFADFALDTDGKTPEQVVDRIREILPLGWLGGKPS